MRRIAVAFVAGVLMGALAIAAWTYFALQERYELGRYMGKLDERGQTLEMLEAEFGRAAPGTGGERILAFKEADVVTVSVDGIKTLRIRR